MQSTTFSPNGQVSTDNKIDIAGYLAWDDPYLLAAAPYTKSKYELDKANLQKLWETGFDIDSLEEAHERYKISPIRAAGDLWKILGYPECPVNPNGNPKYGETDLTCLAIPYPDPQTPGELYPFNEFIRVRYPKSNRSYVKAERAYVDSKYGQPTKFRTVTHSEPYFLCVPEQWQRLYDPKLPLIITEGELKACALGLAQTAGLAFPGISMWCADTKAGKNKLHPSLDPKGNRQKWAIPIENRIIVLIPDGDFRSNKTVRDSVEALAKALLDEGAMEVFIVRMPPPPSSKDNWKGVDDYLTAHLGLRWAGDPDKVTKAGEMIGDLINNHASRGNRTDWNYPATAPERAALRMERKYRREHHYTAAMLSETSEGSRPTGWLMYNEDRYIHVDVYRTIGNTSGKVATDNSPIIRSAMEEWEEGIRIGREEGDVEGKVAGMAADFPNRTLAILAQRLDERQNETLIEPFATVRPGDKCLRIRHGLINLTRLFEVGFDWENREKWLIPPDYRWFSNAHLDVSLSNLTSKPECPIFMAMLRHAFREDQERIDCLQLWFGKILCSPLFLSRQQFLCLYGAAGGGKGTIYRLLLRLLGDNCVAEMRANFGGRFDTAALPGKKLVVFTETPDGSAQGKFDPYMADIIKQITGEDRVICEGKGVKAVSHRIKAEVMTVGNTPPVIPMDEGAFKRRAILVRVSRAFEKRDSAMEDAMQRHELPGILVWALEGAAKLAAGAQIVTPAACQEDLGDVSMSVAPEERFIKTQLTKKSGSILSPADVMEGYQRWILENRIRVSEISKRKLGYLIREHFDIVSEVKSIKGEVKRVYVGLGFISNFY